ncbi:MAG: prolipoprotein diacylglyceryl transferase [Sodaliphilus sp.]
MLDYITWTASPELYSGFLSIRWYGLMFAIGFWFGYEVVWRAFRHEGAPEIWISKLFVYVIVATVVGARLGHVFFYDWAYYSQHLGDIPKIWEGGLASHGGVIGIMVAIWIYSKVVTKRSMLWTFDRVVLPVGVVAALIRIGNLFNHEIYGGPTDLPWAFRFIENIPSYLQGAEARFTVPCHPTQLYEALAYLLTFGVVMWLYWKRNAQEREGLLFGVFMVGIFGARFLVEFVKNVQEPWEMSMRAACGLDMGQVLSIPFIVLGVWLIIRAMRRPRQPLSYPNKFADEKAKK